MRSFARLYNDLDQTTRTLEKTRIMADFFLACDEKDLAWSVALLTGKRPRRPVSSSLVRGWTAELAGIPDWLFEESYAVVGDLSETISLLIARGEAGETPQLSDLMQTIRELSGFTEDQKKEWLFNAWKGLSRDELLVFNKLISGSFRVGVSSQLVFKALARAFGTDERTVAHRLMGNWDPASTDLKHMLLEEAHDDLSRPYPFYLAYQLDQEPESLGDINEWLIERKYDGIRGQIISRGGEVHIWSRGEELMTEKFVEFRALRDILPQGTVLDGEILPFKDGKILAFAEMQKRIGRKNLTKKILQDLPLCMMCYDILEYSGKDIRETPLGGRRKILEALIEEIDHPLLKLSPLVKCSGWDEIETLRNQSREMGCEGLMLKKRSGVYETGRRRGGWWKWKVDPLTVDAVMIYAQAGHGRRANLYTDYTFAVWDGPDLVPFAKAYSGLTDKEILQVDSWIRRNTLEKFGPVRSVKAELVFEIAFEGISRSPRHKSGIALRFPRILRWRKDKKVEEINTRNDLLQLLEAK